jgi:hypothetical protein
VEVVGSSVVYKKAGVVFYQNTSPTIAYPLLVDTALKGQNATIDEVFLAGALLDVGFWCGGTLMPADVNGDGRTDQVCFQASGTEAWVWVRLSEGTGFGTYQTWSDAKFERPMMGDFNSDGRMDVADHQCAARQLMRC